MAERRQSFTRKSFTTFIEIQPPRSHFPNFWSGLGSFWIIFCLLKFLHLRSGSFVSECFHSVPEPLKWDRKSALGPYKCDFMFTLGCQNEMSCSFQLEILIAVLLGDLS